MDSSNSSIFVRLTEAARMGAEEYTSSYAHILSELVRLYGSNPGSVSEVRAMGLDDMSMAIKTSILYNERVTFDVRHDGHGMTLSGFTAEGFKKLGVPDKMQISVPKAQAGLVETAIKQNGVQFMFTMPSGDEIDRFLIDAAPLVNQGRLIPRPRRNVLLMTEERTPEGGRVWSMLDAAPGSSLDAWHIEHEREPFDHPTATDRALAVEPSYETNINPVARDILLPYLSGVSLSDYANIIQDEQDIIVEFRASLKELIEQFNNGSKNLADFQNDVIEPRIAKINRAFDKISSMGRLRIGGSVVATAVLTLATYSTGGIAAAIAAIGGTAGFISTVKEVTDRAEKMRSLKDDPIHLLWRLKGANR